jgi:mannose-6-phosphate isomerase-like protein (cupin superfamily)
MKIKKPLAMCLKNIDKWEKTEFFSPKDLILQAGVIVSENGRDVHPHEHRNLQRATLGTCEILFCLRGSGRMEWGTEVGVVSESFDFAKGDLLISYGGWHSFKLDPGTKLLEVKNGPYLGIDADKSYGSHK